MEGTRLQILQLLQKKRADTVGGLAASMGLAPATVRRHLDILQRDRLVTFEEVRKKTGRPEYSFFLTENGQEALPKSYDMLLRLMVRELSSLGSGDIAGMDGQGVLETLFQRLSTRSEVAQESQALAERVKVLTSLLERDHFLPETEMVDGRLKLRLLNCPFRSVALENKAVCEFDCSVIENVLGIPMTRTGCIHDGQACCTYVSESQVELAGATR